MISNRIVCIGGGGAGGGDGDGDRARALADLGFPEANCLPLPLTSAFTFGATSGGGGSSGPALVLSSMSGAMGDGCCESGGSDGEVTRAGSDFCSSISTSESMFRMKKCHRSVRIRIGGAEVLTKDREGTGGGARNKEQEIVRECGEVERERDREDSKKGKFGGEEEKEDQDEASERDEQRRTWPVRRKLPSAVVSESAASGYQSHPIVAPKQSAPPPRKFPPPLSQSPFPQGHWHSPLR